MQDDYTMVLSAATPKSSLLGGQSMVIDAVSEMSIPAIDPDARFDAIQDKRDELPSFENHNNSAYIVQEIKDEGSARSINAVQEKPEPRATGKDQLIIPPHHVPSAASNFGDKGRPVPGRKKAMSRNLELLKQIGQAEFELRYVRTPAESIINAISMCAANVECGQHERQLAEFWLEVWNDNSRDYKNMVRKGKNLCAL